MIQQLREDQYKSVRSLYRDLKFNLVVDSILDGNTPAWVFVDRAANPRTAMIWNRQDALFLAGDEGNQVFNRAIGDQLVAESSPMPDGAISRRYRFTLIRMPGRAG
jgi:hypothetical protein